MNNKTISNLFLVFSTLLLVIQIIYVTLTYKLVASSGVNVGYFEMWLGYFQTIKGVTAMFVTVSGYFFAYIKRRM